MDKRDGGGADSKNKTDAKPTRSINKVYTAKSTQIMKQKKPNAIKISQNQSVIQHQHGDKPIPISSVTTHRQQSDTNQKVQRIPASINKRNMNLFSLNKSYIKMSDAESRRLKQDISKFSLSMSKIKGPNSKDEEMDAQQVPDGTLMLQSQQTSTLQSPGKSVINSSSKNLTTLLNQEGYSTRKKRAAEYKNISAGQEQQLRKDSGIIMMSKVSCENLTHV